ncbi:MAG TPA: hypothetical protein VMP67_10660 [Candidatus Limnocylindria bacterium]|nr:hypothetical protein [Candidatus Limnocylindria bacterium]
MGRGQLPESALPESAERLSAELLSNDRESTERLSAELLSTDASGVARGVGLAAGREAAVRIRSSGERSASAGD